MEKVLTKIVLAVAVVSRCGPVAADTWEDLEWVRHITTEEIANFKQAAVNGDSDSSYRLSVVYGYHDSYSFINHFFYLRLAAEQGDCRAVLEFNLLQQKETINSDFSVPGGMEEQLKNCRSASKKGAAVR